jgi:hypothetical protein
MTEQRRLAAIVSADVAGYSRLSVYLTVRPEDWMVCGGNGKVRLTRGRGT